VIQRDSLIQSPLAGYNYVRKWYEYFAFPGDVRVYRVRINNETIGIMPLVVRRKWGIRELGNLSRKNDAIPESPIRKGRENKFKDILLSLLVKTSRSWDVFRYENAYSFFLPEGFFDDERMDSNGLKWKKKKEPTYCVSLNKNLEEYFQNDLSKKTRSNLNKSVNKLKRTGDYSFLHLTGKEAIKHWPVFLELEASGWKGAKGTAILNKDEMTRKYYEYLLNNLAGSCDLHLYLLKIQDRPIAAIFSYTQGNVYHWAKTAYDEGSKYYVPSLQLLVHTISSLMKDYPQVKTLHMFPDDFGFKHRFANEPAEKVDTIIYTRVFGVA
jgi:hypothetical protein